MPVPKKHPKSNSDMAGNAKDFLDKAAEEKVVGAIREAELKTSGEIRVHIENRVRGKSNTDRAAIVFHELGMDATEARNGVLIYLAVKDRQFAIIGDKGIDEKVPDDFWDCVRDTMQGHFVSGDFAQGLSDGIRLAGEQLKTYFPYQSDDENELPDEISYS